MPSPSATGAVTRLSRAASDLTDQLKDALTRAAQEKAPFTATGLDDYWPPLSFTDFTAAWCARTKPAPHLAANFRKNYAPTLADAFASQWNWYRSELSAPADLHGGSAEYIASRLVDDFAETAGATWVHLHAKASEEHWSQRRDPDGRITHGTTPSGRRARATFAHLTAQDTETAYKAMLATTGTVRHAVGFGVHRRRARLARLERGMTLSQVESYAGIGGYGYATSAWETNTAAFPDGGGPLPWWWPQLAAALGIPEHLDPGPDVPLVEAPWRALERARREQQRREQPDRPPHW